MGADLVVATLELPDTGKYDIEEWYLLLSAFLNTKSEEEVSDLINDSAFWPEDGDNYSILRNAIEDSILVDSRDKGFYLLHGKWVIITGGMTWGDTPSDSFDSVGLVQMLIDSEVSV